MIHPFDPDKSLELDPAKAIPLLHKVMDNGKRVHPGSNAGQVAAYAKERLALLPEEHKRFNNPHTYKIGISEILHTLRNDLRKHYKK